MIPARNLVGQEGDGFKIAMTALDSGRITIGATAVGIAKAALEVAISHSQHREQFGKPDCGIPRCVFYVSRYGCTTGSFKALSPKAAWLKDNGHPFSQAGAMAKLMATDMAMKVTTDAVRFWEAPAIPRIFRLKDTCARRRSCKSWKARIRSRG